METKYALLLVLLLLVFPACGGGGGGGSSSTAKYTVTYNGNGNTGGSVPVDATNYENGEIVTVPGNTGTLARTGYVFSGWNTNADGSGTTYLAGQTFAMGSENVSLYARWVDESSVSGIWDESTWGDDDWGP